MDDVLSSDFDGRWEGVDDGAIFKSTNRGIAEDRASRNGLCGMEENSTA